MLVDTGNMSMIFKKYRPCPGVMVKTKNGSKFYPDGKVPEDLEGAEVLEGRMEYGKDSHPQERKFPLKKLRNVIQVAQY